MEEIERAIRKLGVSDFITKSNGLYAVDISKFTCDFYDFAKGKPEAVNAYFGEYLSEYSWGEFTAGFLGRSQ